MGAGKSTILGQSFGSSVNNKKAVKVVLDSVDGETVFTSVNPSENTVQPSIGMNYIICINGMYPSRS